MLFSYGNIYLLYIYIIFFFSKSHKVQPAQLVRKEYLQKGSGSSFSCHVDQVCFYCSWVLAEKKKKKKKMLLKNDHMRRRALFFIHAHLPSLAPPFSLLACCCTSHAFQQNSVSYSVLGILGT